MEVFLAATTEEVYHSRMPSDQQAPATKQDIHLLMEQMGKYYQQTAQRFADMEERMKEMAERITREGKETQTPPGGPPPQKRGTKRRPAGCPATAPPPGGKKNPPPQKGGGGGGGA